MSKSNVVELEKKRNVEPTSTIQLAQHARREFIEYPEHGVTIEDVTKPEYWSHVAERFEPLNTWVDVIAIDGSWVARLLVVKSGRNWAKTHTVYHHEIDGNTEEIKSDEFDVNFAPSHKWRFVRKSDGEVIQKDFSSKEEARKAMLDYQKTIES